MNLLKTIFSIMVSIPQFFLFKIQNVDVTWNVSKGQVKLFAWVVSILSVLSVLHFALKIPLPLAVPYGILPIFLLQRILLFLLAASLDEEGEDVVLKREKEPASLFWGSMAGLATCLILRFWGGTLLGVPFGFLVGWLTCQYVRNWYSNKIYAVKNLQVIVRNGSFPLPVICPVEHHSQENDVWAIGYDRDNQPLDLHGVPWKKSFGFVQVEDAAVKVKIFKWVGGLSGEGHQHYILHIGTFGVSAASAPDSGLPEGAEELGMVEFQ